MSHTQSRHVLMLASTCAAALAVARTASATQTLRYTFDEASGNAINVANPGTYDGTFNTAGIARNSDAPGGGPGNSVLSDGADGGSGLGSYILVSGSSSADPFDSINSVGGKFTLTTWFKPVVIGTDVFLSNLTSSGGLAWSIQNVNASTPVSPSAFTLQMFARTSAGGEWYTNRSAVIDSTVGGIPNWLFLAANFDGTSTGGVSNRNIHFYVGTETGAVADLGNISGAPGTFFGETNNLTSDPGVIFSGASSLRVGSNPRTANKTPNAYFDDVRIYNGDLLNAAQLDIIRLENNASAGGASWNVDNDGDWTTGPWTAAAPNAWGVTANFGTIIGAPRIVTVDAAQTVGALSFSSPIAYTIAGSNAITLDGPHGFIEVTAGSHTIAAPVTLNDDTTITTAATTGVALTGDLTATGKRINKAGAGSVQFGNVRALQLNIAAGKVGISAKGSPNDVAGTSVVTSLSIFSGAQLDLANNSMVIDFTGAVGTREDDVRQHLLNGRLTSSSATTSTKLGYADNAALGRTDLAGQTVDADSILIKFTYAGDTNLDGQVTISDLGDLASNWQSTTAVWRQGDFNYDGAVTISDLGDLASNWQAGVGSPLGMSFQQALAAVGLGNTVVPEPATLGLVGLGLLASASRRRRRRA